ncbi:MAG: peptidoglycan D,D-transpeptidase FtsI family protein [Phycisphaerae bacterium]
MAEKTRTWRFELVFLLLAATLVALGTRLAVLVRDQRDQVVDLALRQETISMPIPARVGSIYGSTRGRYVLLAGSHQVPSCFVDPGLLEDRQVGDVAVAVARVLNISAWEVQQTIFHRRNTRFAWVKRGITRREADEVRALGIRAVGITYEWRRQYPNGPLGCDVLGFRRRDGVAGGGLELALDGHLSAKDGRRVMLADARRRPIWSVPEKCSLPRDGRNVYLCVDAVIQGFLQEAVTSTAAEFGAEWATGIVMDPHTGEILAMCSAPTFNPNRYNTADPNHMTNHVIVSPYEPGSVFKPIIAAAAVQLGRVSYDSVIPIGQYNGVYHADRGGRISDHGKTYDDLTVEDGVVHSSNILMSKLGEMLGNERLHRVVRAFGFGQETDVPLRGECAGIIRDLRKWDGYSLRRVPFGQEVSTTSMQLTTAFAALVNGGELLRPRLVSRITDPNGQVVYRGQRQVVRRLLSPQVSRRTREVLGQVVERGTGKRCRLSRWSSFGKTGTAQVSGPGGYPPGQYTGSFIGGAPVEKPAVICLISVYRPDPSRGYYGGTVAAPYVRDVLERTLQYLQVPSDRTEEMALRP